MEDIVFDLKAPEGWKDPSLDRYNEKEQLLLKSEHNLDSKYSGAYDLYNPCHILWDFMVVLQLNGHKLSQNEAFYNQQTFLAIISLCGQVFLRGQGAGFSHITSWYTRQFEYKYIHWRWST